MIISVWLSQKISLYARDRSAFVKKSISKMSKIVKKQRNFGFTFLFSGQLYHSYLWYRHQVLNNMLLLNIKSQIPCLPLLKRSSPDRTQRLIELWKMWKIGVEIFQDNFASKNNTPYSLLLLFIVRKISVDILSIPCFFRWGRVSSWKRWLSPWQSFWLLWGPGNSSHSRFLRLENVYFIEPTKWRSVIL